MNLKNAYSLMKDFRLAPQLKKRTAAKLQWGGVEGLGLFGQNVGLFGQMAKKCKKNSRSKNAPAFKKTFQVFGNLEGFGEC